MSKHVIVIGGGISGLAAAHRLTELSRAGPLELKVTLLEASDRLGGVIATEHTDDLLLELGPDSYITDKPAALRLCERLGLTDRLIAPQHADGLKLYTVHRGRLEPLPEGFLLMAPTRVGSVLRSPLFSWSGKLRMGLEPVIPRRSGDGDESLASFVRRRLGREVLERVAQPLIGGIYASDPEHLSLAATMPRFPEMERNHGSVILGSRQAQKRRAQSTSETGARWSLFVSIDGGMEVLVRRIEEALGPGVVRLGEAVRELSWNPNTRRWRVATERTVSDQSSGGLEADAVICTLPASIAAKTLTALDPEVAKELNAIPFSSTAIVNLAYRRGDIAHPLDGYGFVVPHVEERKIMACTFSSVKYAGRAPEDIVLLRCFVGGALQPHLLDQPDGVMEAQVQDDLGALLDISGEPIVRRTTRYPHSMPQYNVGHMKRVERIARKLKYLPTLALAGKSYRGVGIADCIASGETAAETAAESLALWHQD
ncbi:MAG: protoporphyrinogen oxidase [Deltaproteobacteria bacterium]|nr:protoporphyrinogen oxidase [Deltaproteobacteria bacterium]